MSIACIVWTSSYIYSNENDLDMYEANIAKGVVGAIMNYLVIYFWKIPMHLHIRRVFIWLFIINACVLSYFYTLPLSQVYLPLPIVHTIGCSSIATVAVIDFWINGTKMTNKGLMGVLLSLIGVALMANNRFFVSLFDKDFVFDSDFNNYRDSTILFSSFIGFILFLSRTINSYGLVKLKHFPEITVFELNFHNNILGLFTSSLGYMMV